MKVRFKILLPGFIVLAAFLFYACSIFFVSRNNQRAYLKSSELAQKVGNRAEEIQILNEKIPVYLLMFRSTRENIQLELLQKADEALKRDIFELNELLSEKTGSEVLLEFYERYESAKKLRREIVESVQRDKIDEADRLLSQFLIVSNANTARVRDINGLKIKVLEAQRDELRSAYHWISLTVLASALLAMLAIIGLTIYYEVVFIRPLERLGQTISRIKGGEFDLHMPAVYQDELGSLKEALERMLREIRKYFEEQKTLNSRLQSANDELEHFTFIASHDLKEPLRTVSTYTQLIQARYRGSLDPEADTYFHEIVEGCRRMNGMISGLLGLYSITSSRQAFSRISMQDLLQSASDSLRSLIEDSKTQIIHENLPSIRGDARQLTQLLQNLIANAIKYNQSKPPVIQVFVKSQTENMVTIAIEDNGIGFDHQYSEKIFKLFARLHSRDQYAGSGIGLALCRKIVSHHGGKMWASSRPGVGSTFFFTLPLAVEEIEQKKYQMFS